MLYWNILTLRYLDPQCAHAVLEHLTLRYLNPQSVYVVLEHLDPKVS
jgi:hypothetical protein